METLPPNALQIQTDLTGLGKHWRRQQEQHPSADKGRPTEITPDPSPRILLSLTLREALPSFSCLWGVHGGCDRQYRFISADNSTIDFTASLLLVGAQTESQLSLGVIVSRDMEISQHQMMCCTWIFLRMELFAQNQAVINTINQLQEAGPVSQHLLHYLCSS